VGIPFGGPSCPDGDEDKSSMIPTSLGRKFILLKPITFDRAFEGIAQV